MGILALLLAASAVSSAEKWQTMSFTADTEKGFSDLSQYCLAHELAVNDVLWANHIEEESIKAGSKIYLPVNKAELLAIWQHIGAWNPKPFVTTTKAEQPEQKTSASVQPEERETPKSEQPVSESKIAAAESKPKSQPQPKTEPKKSASAGKSRPITPKTTAQNAAAKKQETPAKVIAQTAKPDKILTAKPKRAKQEISGLMDPIIVMSPNGDETNGPMRLVISGDKVEVVKLPPGAAPKKPGPSDIDAPFTSGYSYLSFYNAPGQPRNNNNVMTNLNILSGKMMWPVDGRISSPFGRWRGKHKHEGIDIPMPGGTPIRAARNGVVIRTGNNSTIGFRGYGNFVMVDHGGNVRTFYAHCSRVAVVEGQRVMQGQVIAYVGSTGRSTANHLHFEVRINNAKVNPVPYLAGNSQLASHK